MKIAMHEITTRDGTFPEHMEAYAKTGWKHFEINMWHAEAYFTEHGIDAAVKVVTDNGLQCVGCTGISMSAFGDAEARQGDIDGVQKVGERMQALGCSALVVGCDVPAERTRENYPAHLDTMAAHVRQMADAAAPFGVTIAAEVNWCALCKSYRTAADMVSRADRSNVGLIWDPAHFVSTPSRVDDLDLARGKIVHAHLNDIRADTHWEVMDINADRVIPGDGILPLKAWTEKVEECGYDGYHCVELFNAELWDEDLETICTKVMSGCKSVWPDAQF
ncbi:MAG: sugar phosphate isomerase/epimerase [Verrucomicrobia bacterium]|nr:sugar phosphate isomerase/epimerase [Verrucomicrobiota bacterium]MDA1086073.1 sugar phosphate isomerase/epimerase [Verrucomicrobiota bacterium]